MTFAEYLTQSDRLSHGQVKMVKSDFHSIYKNVETFYRIKIGENVYTYSSDDNGLLWTTDSDGNKLKRSVFSLAF